MGIVIPRKNESEEIKMYNDTTSIRMPDIILNDFSNLRTVVEQFRNLGHNDTYILETIINIADIKNDHELDNLFYNQLADISGKC